MTYSQVTPQQMDEKGFEKHWSLKVATTIDKKANSLQKTSSQYKLQRFPL